VSDKNSATIEDYLEILLILQRDGVPVVGARLAELLKVSPPTVTNTLKRMARDGLVVSSENQGPVLTQAGLEMARSVMRRHMLTEWLLVRMLNIPWSQTHAEAHFLEHTVSKMLEEQMVANLGDPKTCPHGNPMPGYESVTAAWTPLSEIQPGKTVILRRVHEFGESQPELMRYLEDNQLMPGAELVVTEILPFNQTLTLRSHGRSLVLGLSAAHLLFVEQNPA
jgi:DtxR family transcriptional regulator, Mn-dependent transcriptional regulator